jgi:ribonuclease T2
MLAPVSVRSLRAWLKDLRMLTSRIAAVAIAVLSLLGAAAVPASAQRYDNRYDRYDNDNDSGNRSGGSGRNVAGQFDYYALVLSWSPTHCASTQRDDDTQCNRRDGRRYNFVLHGLWPQYERGFPGDCQIGRRPYVPDNVIEDAMDVMPSKPLIIHEYRKHGTCSGMEPSQYFEMGERLFRSIKIPSRYTNPYEQQSVSPEDFIDEFLAENKQLKRDQIVVSCDGSRNRLKDVRICLTQKGEPRSCGRNENQRKLCSASSMFVPPVRSSADARTDGPGAAHKPREYGNRDRGNAPRGGSGSGNRNDDSPLPGPRMDRYDGSL